MFGRERYRLTVSEEERPWGKSYRERETVGSMKKLSNRRFQGQITGQQGSDAPALRLVLFTPRRPEQRVSFIDEALSKTPEGL